MKTLRLTLEMALFSLYPAIVVAIVFASIF